MPKDENILNKKTQDELNELKVKLTELLYWVFLIAMWFALLGPVIRTIDIGLRPQNYLLIAMVVLFIVSFIIRNFINHTLRSFLLLVNLLIMGASGIFTYGLFSQGLMFMLLLILISSIIFNSKIGFITFAISLLIVCIVSSLYITEILVVDKSITDSVHKFSGWFMAVLIFSIISIIVIMFWQRLLKFLIHKIDEVNSQKDNIAKINRLLKKEVESRKQTELLLKEQFSSSKKLNKKYELTNNELQQALHNLEKSNLLLHDAKEKAQSADRLKSSFLSNMGYEIRTPLNAILGFSSLLSNDNISKDEYDSYLKLIQNSTQGLLTTISDIVTMAKLEAKQYTLKPELIDLKKLIEEIQNQYQNRISEDSNQIKFEIFKNLSESYAIADKQCIKEIISKLIDNALKFTSEGIVSVNVKMQLDGSLHITVKDTGIGIMQNIKDEIYNTFSQLDNNKTRKYSGTGLGLSIVKGFLSLLNGTIEFQSEPGKGSTFFVSIPLILKTGESSGNKKNIAWEGSTIIIVGKECWENKNLNALLLESKAILKYAENSFQAIDILKAHPETNLVLVAININEIQPTKFIGLVREIRPLIPLIAYNPFNKSINEDTDSWDGYFYNPIDRNLVVRIFENYLGELEEKSQ